MRFAKNEIVKGTNPVSTKHLYKNKAMSKAKVLDYVNDNVMVIEVLEHSHNSMLGRRLTVYPHYFEKI